MLLLSVAGAAQAVRLDVLEAFRRNRSGEQAAALALARSALEAFCLRRERIAVPAQLPPVFRQRSGVFVSAMLGDAPRCCMGSLFPTKSCLAEEIVDAAAAAAAADWRFPALRPEELPALRVIVSVVGPPEAITSPWLVDPVNEGLAAHGTRRTGVVLPGETPHPERMVAWAKVRAAVKPGDRIQWFRLRAVRMIETPAPPQIHADPCGWEPRLLQPPHPTRHCEQ